MNRLDLLVRGVRSVVRAAMGGVGHHSPASGPLSEAVLDLARAIQAPADYFEKPSDPKDARRFLLDAAGKVTTALIDHEGDLVTSVSVGQIRTTAVNLLISHRHGSNASPPGARRGRG